MVVHIHFLWTFDGHIEALGGWLAQKGRPHVSNQADYFSGHYQCFGSNIQVLCDSDLIFIYVCIAASEKQNMSELLVDVLVWWII